MSLPNSTSPTTGVSGTPGADADRSARENLAHARALAANPDVLVVLGTDRPAAKRWTPQGIEPAADAWRVSPALWHVKDFAMLGAGVRQLATLPNTIVIRGEPIRPVEAGARLRRSRDHVKDGRIEPAEFVETPRRWMMIDADKVPVPADVDPRDPAALVGFVHTWILKHLPAAFHHVAAVVNLSGSAGHPAKAERTLSFHLWFLLDAPMGRKALETWLGDAVDVSVFRSVQPHFSADPIVPAGMVDPFAGRRVFVLRGDGWRERVDNSDLPPSIAERARLGFVHAGEDWRERFGIPADGFARRIFDEEASREIDRQAEWAAGRAGERGTDRTTTALFPFAANLFRLAAVGVLTLDEVSDRWRVVEDAYAGEYPDGKLDALFQSAGERYGDEAECRAFFGELHRRAFPFGLPGAPSEASGLDPYAAVKLAAGGVEGVAGPLPLPGTKSIRTALSAAPPMPEALASETTGEAVVPEEDDDLDRWRVRVWSNIAERVENTANYEFPVLQARATKFDAKGFDGGATAARRRDLVVDIAIARRHAMSKAAGVPQLAGAAAPFDALLIQLGSTPEDANGHLDKEIDLRARVDLSDAKIRRAPEICGMKILGPNVMLPDDGLTSLVGRVAWRIQDRYGLGRFIFTRGEYWACVPADNVWRPVPRVEIDEIIHRLNGDLIAPKGEGSKPAAVVLRNGDVAAVHNRLENALFNRGDYFFMNKLSPNGYDAPGLADEHVRPVAEIPLADCQLVIRAGGLSSRVRTPDDRVCFRLGATFQEFSAEWMKPNAALLPMFLDGLFKGDEDAEVKKRALAVFLAVAVCDITFSDMRMLILRGVAQSGKSQIIKLAQMLLPEGTHVSYDPTGRGGNFVLSDLVGKRLASNADLADVGVRVDELKKLADGSVLTADRKYRDPVQFRFDGLLLFATNKHVRPLGGEIDDGFARRLNILDFKRAIPENEKQAHPNIAREIVDTELAALLCFCARGAQAILAGGRGLLPADVRDMLAGRRREEIAMGDPVRAFVEEELFVLPDEAVLARGSGSPRLSTAEAFTVFGLWAQGANEIEASRLSRRAFTERLKIILSGLSGRDRFYTPNGHAGLCIFGAMLRSEALRTGEIRAEQGAGFASSAGTQAGFPPPVGYSGPATGFPPTSAPPWAAGGASPASNVFPMRPTAR